jgi:AcrR family transcriptional regulator
MKNTSEVKELIINATTQLIEQSNGNINGITTRAIAEKSGVALGLVNYHFKSKESLIALCVQRIINTMLMKFSPDKTDYTKTDGLTDKERLISFAQQTFDYLYANYSIVKISILSDFANYLPKSNSAFTQMGFRFALQENISESKKQLIAFSLTSIMQTAFLSGENSVAITGYNLMEKTQRDRFIADTVSMLMEDIYEQ